MHNTVVLNINKCDLELFGDLRTLRLGVVIDGNDIKSIYKKLANNCFDKP